MSSSRPSPVSSRTNSPTAVRIVYATDNSIYQLPPSGVLVPESASEVCDLVRANAESVAPQSLTARGGGTGTNGQSLTSGLIVDVKRAMHRLVALDVEGRTVTVEPGMVTAELNEHLRPHGLFWPPETSTVSRATIGGMISTDAAGKGSLAYGRTSRHVVALEVVLDDGTLWQAEAVPEAEAERRAAGDGRIAEIWRALLDVPGGPFDLPELARGFSGYGIDRVRHDGLVDPIPVLCGSEGTLGIIVSATLTLTPIPAHSVLLIAGYASFDDALTDSLRLTDSAPTAIETIDETTLECGRSSTAWHLLAPVIGSQSGSILLLEYSGDEPRDVAEVEARIRDGGRATAVQIVTEPAVATAAWKVRADAVGLLAKVAPGQPKPTAFVEDCAVPVRRMPEFIARFRAILDGHGVTYGMFGHADVGCVHVRPALELLDPTQESKVAEITADVVALLTDMGGILWGEHGRGVRGQFVVDFLEPEMIDIMRGIKTAFDPNDRFNPGKLYRPLGVATPLLQIDTVPTRAARDRMVPLAVREEFATAFSCNGNGLCHHYSTAEVMCPSFKATGDPVQAPKGRADLLRAWLATEESEPSTELTEAVAETLHRCLSCAACTGRCPVQVDIPELKSRFFERYYRTNRRPVSHRLLARFEQLASVAALAPPLAELGARLFERRLGLVDLPTPARRRRPTMPEFDPSHPTEVVLLPDVFTSTFEPAVEAAAQQALQSVGYSVSRARFVPSGKFDHVKGDRGRFAKAAASQKALLEQIVSAGAVPVTIDPAVSLLFGHEYPAIAPGFPSDVVRNIADVLAERSDRLARSTEPRTLDLFGHCTERSLAPHWVAGWKTVLEAAGHQVNVVETTCCGMAGIFGHEAGNQEVSRRLWDMGWKDRVAASTGPIATGWSCRSQGERFGSDPISHPLLFLTSARP